MLASQYAQMQRRDGEDCIQKGLVEGGQLRYDDAKGPLDVAEVKLVASAIVLLNLRSGVVIPKWKERQYNASVYRLPCHPVASSAVEVICRGTREC